MMRGAVSLGFTPTGWANRDGPVGVALAAAQRTPPPATALPTLDVLAARGLSSPWFRLVYSSPLD